MKKSVFFRQVKTTKIIGAYQFDGEDIELIRGQKKLYSCNEYYSTDRILNVTIYERTDRHTNAGELITSSIFVSFGI